MIRGAWAVLLVGLLVAPRAAAGDPPVLKIGMVQGMFKDVSPALAAAVAKPFQGLMERQTGATGTVQMVADAHALAKLLADNALNVGVLHGFEYGWVKDDANLVPLAVTHPQGRNLHACVVVNAADDAKTVADLKGDCVVVPKGLKAHCPLYFDGLKKGQPDCTACVNATPGGNTEDVLNAVARGDTKAALVDAGALAGYQGVQPGAAKSLKVLCKSDPFPSTVIVYRKGALDDATVSRLRSGLTGADRTPQYKPLLMLWNLKGFEEPSAEYLDLVDVVRKAYPAPTPVLTAVPVGRGK